MLYRYSFRIYHQNDPKKITKVMSGAYQLLDYTNDVTKFAENINTIYRTTVSLLQAGTAVGLASRRREDQVHVHVYVSSPEFRSQSKFKNSY
jgi:hypothetical protein